MHEHEHEQESSESVIHYNLKVMLQVHASTGVTHCAVAYFTQLDAKGNLPDLVVTTSSLLQLYSIRLVAFLSPCLPLYNQSRVPEMLCIPSGQLPTGVARAGSSRVLHKAIASC